MTVNARIEFIKEARGWQAAPAFMPQRFVPGAAAATADILRASGAGKQRRHPVTQLNPRDGGLRDGAILTGDVQNLRPEPFAGVNAANIAGVVDLTAYGTDE